MKRLELYEVRYYRVINEYRYTHTIVRYRFLHELRFRLF